MRGNKRTDFEPWAPHCQSLHPQLLATLAAVGRAFPFLDEEEILFPARGTNGGASLARHLLMFVLMDTFRWSKWRTSAFGSADWKTTRKAFRTFQVRMQKPRFRAWVEAVAEDAVVTYEAGRIA